MKNIFKIVLTLVLILFFPLNALAVWVDADHSGQNDKKVYNGMSWVSVALDSEARPHIAF